MILNNWTTSSLPAEEQFGYWREVICAKYTPLSAERKNKAGSFRGGIRTQELAGINVSNICAEAQTVSHGHREIASAKDDFYFLLMQKVGVGYISQDNSECMLRPGDFTILDTERPYRLAFDDDFEQVCINIPQHMLKARFSRPENITARKISGSDDLARLGMNYLHTLQNIEALSANVDRDKLVNNFLDLLPLIFNSQRSDVVELSRYKNVQLDAVYDFIHRNLADPALSPSLVANYLGVSVRYIHKIFTASEDSFGRTVLSLRLKRCADDLRSQTLQNRSIAEIAYLWGFNDLSYFGKCFKKHYQMTPRDWRHSCSQT